MSRATEAAARLIALPEGHVPDEPPTRTHVHVGPRHNWQLTPAELRVLRHLARGLSNPEIGRELFLEEQTIKFHLTNAYKKLGARNRVEAVIAAFKLGIVPAPVPRPEHVYINDVRYEPVDE